MCPQRRLRSAWTSAQFAVRMKQPWFLSFPVSTQQKGKQKSPGRATGRSHSQPPTPDWTESLLGAHHLVGFVMLQFNWLSMDSIQFTRSILPNFIVAARSRQILLWKPESSRFSNPDILKNSNSFLNKALEPPYDKTNKMACAPSEDSDKPEHPPSLIRVFAMRSVGS